MNRLNPTLLSAIALLALSTPALAQDSRKPLPPPPAEPDPVPGGLERLASYHDWLAAYQRAGSPRLLFYTDLLTTSRGDTKLLNDSATITRLGGRIEQWFRSPEVILLSPGAVSITTDEQRKTLQGSDEFAAASMLSRQASADIVVLIRLIEQSGRKDGALYTGTYLMADLRQGTSIDRHSWDMYPDHVSGEFDATRMAQYAQALADRISNTFILQFPPAVTNIPIAPAPIPAPAPAPSPINVPDQGPDVAPSNPAVAPSNPAVAPTNSTVAPTNPIPTLTPGAPTAPAIANQPPQPPAFTPAFTPAAPTLAPRRFTLRLVGDYEDQLVVNFRDAIRNLAWMQPGSLVERGLSADNSGKSMVFELTYAGSVIDLQNELAALAADRLEQDTAVLQARDGLIVLQLRPARLSARERQLVAGRDTYTNMAVRQQFRDAYTRAGRPTIAVMVNPAAPGVELKTPSSTEGASVLPANNGGASIGGAGVPPANSATMGVPPASTPSTSSSTPAPESQPSLSDQFPQVIVAPRIVVGGNNSESGSTATDPMLAHEQMFRRERELIASRSIDTRAMEDNLYQRFIRLGADTRELATAQAALDNAGPTTGYPATDQQLAQHLGAIARAAIVISGSGQVVRYSPDGYPSRLRYTFRAYRTSDNTVLAADSVEDDVDYTKPEWSRAIDRLADEAAAKLATQLMDGWNAGK